MSEEGWLCTCDRDLILTIVSRPNRSHEKKW